MKKAKTILALLLTTFFAAGVSFACFVSDPSSNTNNPTTTIIGENGSSTGTTIGGGSTSTGGNVWYPGWGDDPEDSYEYALSVETSFPVTLNINFSKFLDENGEEVSEPVTRMCILYFSPEGKWIIYKEIKNPEFTVISDDVEDERALFGKHTITSSLGYKNGETLPILLYYRTENYENFNLSEILSSKSPKPLNNTVIALVVKDNSTPF